MYLGLDLGTSGLKAVLIGSDETILASAESGYGVANPHPGWSEQNPEDWIRAASLVMASLRDSAPAAFNALNRIGLSGQMHGATLLDASDRVLRPCMLWNDVRSHAEAARLDAMPEFREVTGNVVFPGFTAPKLDWTRVHEPGVWRRVGKVLLPKDYLRLWMTGDHASDVSDSAGTAWMDVGNRCWSETLLEFCGLSLQQMPALVEGPQPSGFVRRDLLAEWGIGHPVTVVGGGGDNAAAACGMGCVGSGDALVSVGTSGVVLAARDAYRPEPASAVHTFCHALPESWYQMGVCLSATDSIGWLAGLLGSTPEELSLELGDVVSGPARVRFLPYLSGERTPHNDSVMRGAFAGLERASDRRVLAQAVMEGVCFALRDCLEALHSTGAKVERLLATGGGSRSTFWMKSLASTLGVPLLLPSGGDLGAAFGAARLARVGASADAGGSADLKKPATGKEFLPEAGLVDKYDEAYRSWRDLYPALKRASPE